MSLDTLRSWWHSWSKWKAFFFTCSAIPQLCWVYLFVTRVGHRDRLSSVNTVENSEKEKDKMVFVLCKQDQWPPSHAPNSNWAPLESGAPAAGRSGSPSAENDIIQKEGKKKEQGRKQKRKKIDIERCDRTDAHARWTRRTLHCCRHGYQTAYRKDHSLSAIFLIYSIFSNRNQMSLFSRKAYDKLITMTGRKGGVPMLVGEL